MEPSPHVSPMRLSVLRRKLGGVGRGLCSEGVCVLTGEVRILGQGLSGGLLIWRWTGWGVGRLHTRRHTHQMGPPTNLHLPT